MMLRHKDSNFEGQVFWLGVNDVLKKGALGNSIEHRLLSFLFISPPSSFSSRAGDAST